MSDIATGSKDTETETKDPEGDGAKDGENDLLNLFKGAGVGAMAELPRTVTPFDMTQRDIRIQAPTMLSDIVETTRCGSSAKSSIRFGNALRRQAFRSGVKRFIWQFIE